MYSGYTRCPEFVPLPHFQPTWSQSKGLLQRLIDHQVKDWNEFNDWMKLATVPCWDTKGSETSVVPIFFKNQKFTLLSVSVTQEAEFYSSLLPWIAEMALDVETAFPEQIPYLGSGTEREILLNKRMSFHRNVDSDRAMQFWEELNVPLTDMEIDRKNGILEYPEPALRIDFANMYIGGGVLDYGNVQEELYFATHPELYLSMLCCAVMQDNEAIVVVGAERVATYTGYGYPASFNKVDIERRQTDAQGRLEHYMVAMDARPYGYSKTQQFAKTEVLRELNKAYVGFRGDPHEHHRVNSLELKPIVTGNWGCGMFGGDPQLKSLIQWIAATATGRKIAYCVHNDRRLTGDFEEVVERYRRKPANVLLADIFSVFRTHEAQLSRQTTLFEQLLQPYSPHRTTPEPSEPFSLSMPKLA